MLPPICTSRPASRRICATSAVVVDLPLVPVMATNGASGATRSRSRQNSSMSPTTGTPAASARAADQCGSGCVRGTPGDRIRALRPDQSAARRSRVPMPCPAALATRAGSSSQARTPAPPAASASAVARPEPPSPNSATRCPAKLVTGVMEASSGSAQLQRRQADQRQQDGDDPEPDDDLRLLPALLLEVVVKRRHPEHALAGELERRDLDDHRQRLEHEQPADDAEH